MRRFLQIIFYGLLILSLPGFSPAQSSLGNIVQGRVQAPPALLERVAGANITSLYGIPIGMVDGVGGFSMEPPLVDDLDILFVRDRLSDETVLIGYGHDRDVDISVASTAIGMMMILNPANATLDLNGKLQLITAMRSHPKFSQLIADVEKSLLSGESPSSPNNRDMIALMHEIQNSVPRPAAPAGATQMMNPVYMQN